MPPTAEKVWNNELIKGLREKRGLTTTQLAAKCDCTAQTITNWEAGTTVPDIRDFLQLCRALDCDPVELLPAA